MMYPILCKVKFETLHRTFRQRALWIQLAFSVVVNWIVAPLFMVRYYHSLSSMIVADIYFSSGWHGLSSLMKEVSEKG